MTQTKDRDVTCTRCGGKNFIHLCRNCEDLSSRDAKVRNEALREIEYLLKHCSQELDSDYIVPVEKQNEVMQDTFLSINSTIARLKGGEK